MSQYLKFLKSLIGRSSLFLQLNELKTTKELIVFSSWQIENKPASSKNLRDFESGRKAGFLRD